jgi:hypothetical protein
VSISSRGIGTVGKATVANGGVGVFETVVIMMGLGERGATRSWVAAKRVGLCTLAAGSVTKGCCKAIT